MAALTQMAVHSGTAAAATQKNGWRPAMLVGDRAEKGAPTARVDGLVIQDADYATSGRRFDYRPPWRIQFNFSA